MQLLTFQHWNLRKVFAALLYNFYSGRSPYQSFMSSPSQHVRNNPTGTSGTQTLQPRKPTTEEAEACQRQNRAVQARHGLHCPCSHTLWLPCVCFSCIKKQRLYYTFSSQEHVRPVLHHYNAFFYNSKHAVAYRQFTPKEKVSSNFDSHVTSESLPQTILH